MNTKSVISGLMAVCMIASAPAFAQRYDNGSANRNDQVQRGNDYNRDHDNGRNDRNDRNDRAGRYGHDDYRPSHSGYYGSRDYGHRNEMRRGGYVPSDYRGGRYVVSDWRGRHLSAPPRGHQWVQVGNDYVLAAIATGLIAQVLINH